MPLDYYGVVLGQYSHFDTDDLNDYGSDLHGHVFLTAPAAGESMATHRCAVNVKAPNGIIEYVRLRIAYQDVAPVFAMADGSTTS